MYSMELLEFVDAWITELGPKVENNALGMLNEAKAFIKGLLDESEDVFAVEYGNREEAEYLTAIPYGYVSRNDPKESREGRILSIAGWCAIRSLFDYNTLLEIRRKITEGIDLHDREKELIQDLKQNKDLSRYLNIIRK